MSTQTANPMRRIQSFVLGVAGAVLVVTGIIVFGVPVAGPAALAAGVVTVVAATLVFTGKPVAAVLILLAAVALMAVVIGYNTMAGGADADGLMPGVLVEPGAAPTGAGQPLGMECSPVTGAGIPEGTVICTP